MLIWVSLLFSGFSACTKERATPKPIGQDFALPSSFYIEYQQKVQTFTVDSPGTGLIIGKQGTKLSGYDSVFMYPGGQNVYYPFTLQLIEVYTGRDMILSNLPSVAGGAILQTMGEISVNAFKGGTQLALKPGRKYFLELDTNTSLLNGMSVFYGFTNNQNLPDWTNNVSALNSSISPDNLSAVINNPYFYSMNIARMGWVSCAQYNSGAASTAITFTSSGSNIQNINVFLVFSSIHSVMQVYNLKSQPVPVGSNLTVVAISMDSNSGNSMVYDIQNITVAAGQQVTLNMADVSEVNLFTALSAFK
jgi:hypothetical protein